MATYVQLEADGGNKLLVEVHEQEVSPPQGVEKAGLRDVLARTVAVGTTTFDELLGGAVRLNARALVKSVNALEEPPDEAEITFGLNVTGEVGNWAIAKGGGQANYVVRLAWNRPRTRQE